MTLKVRHRLTTNLKTISNPETSVDLVKANLHFKQFSTH